MDYFNDQWREPVQNYVKEHWTPSFVPHHKAVHTFECSEIQEELSTWVIVEDDQAFHQLIHFTAQEEGLFCFVIV